MKSEYLENKIILITGVAGFIGANLASELFSLTSQITIIGVDNLNEYYDVQIKEYRLNKIIEAKNKKSESSWTFICGDISDSKFVKQVFNKYNPNIVVNLAAQAGVRYSIENPDTYIESNLIGFYNILEACRNSCVGEIRGVEHLVFASSSSVYGANKEIPYSTNDKTDNPVSLYAATKKSNELMAHAYSTLFDIPTTGLRFFTVYGPAGRPDMAYFDFTNKLVKGEKIKIFNYGNCKRDFTYIGDIVEGLVHVMKAPPRIESNKTEYFSPPFKVYNIGNNKPVNLLDFIEILKDELIKSKVLPSDFDLENHKELVAMQPGDVQVTFADISDLERDIGFRPHTSLRDGLHEFAIWYKDFYFTQRELKK